MSIETQLRAALQDEAASVASGEPDPYGRVSAAVGRSRHRRVVGVGVRDPSQHGEADAFVAA